MCVICYHPIYSGRQACERTRPGSQRRKVTQDFSTFLLPCLLQFFSREGFSRSFPSSTVKSNELIVLHLLVGHISVRVTAPTRIRTHVPTSKGFEVAEPPGRPAIAGFLRCNRFLKYFVPGVHSKSEE